MKALTDRQRKHISMIIYNKMYGINGWNMSEQTLERQSKEVAKKIENYLTRKKKKK